MPKEPTFDAFLSYAREDAEVAQQVIKTLNERGLTVWVDKAMIRDGDAYDQRIKDGARQCATLVLLLSPASLKSRYVAMEATRAEAQGKRIFPIHVAPIASGTLVEPFNLVAGRIEGLFWHQNPSRERWDRFATAIHGSVAEYRAARGANSGESTSTRRIAWSIAGIVAAGCIAVFAWNFLEDSTRREFEARLRNQPKFLRELAYGSVPARTLSSPEELSFRFGVYGWSRSAAQWVSLESGDSLRSGDKYFIRADPLSSGYLYIVQVDSSGKIQGLFPKNPGFEASFGTNPVSSSQRIDLPPDHRTVGYALDDVTGDEHFIAFLTAEPWPEIEQALSIPETTPARMDAPVMLAFAARAKGAMPQVVPLDAGPAEPFAGKPVQAVSNGWKTKSNCLLRDLHIQHKARSLSN